MTDSERYYNLSTSIAYRAKYAIKMSQNFSNHKDIWLPVANAFVATIVDSHDYELITGMISDIEQEFDFDQKDPYIIKTLETLKGNIL